jgi:hypothetical protein
MIDYLIHRNNRCRGRYYYFLWKREIMKLNCTYCHIGKLCRSERPWVAHIHEVPSLQCGSVDGRQSFVYYHLCNLFVFNLKAYPYLKPIFQINITSLSFLGCKCHTYEHWILISCPSNAICWLSEFKLEKLYGTTSYYSSWLLKLLSYSTTLKFLTIY